MKILPNIKCKNSFEESLEKLDLQGVLLLLTVLTERALYLHSISELEKKRILKPTLDSGINPSMSILGSSASVPPASLALETPLGHE